MNEERRKRLVEDQLRRIEETLPERLEDTNSIIEEPRPSLKDKGRGPFESLYWHVKNAFRRRDK